MNKLVILFSLSLYSLCCFAQNDSFVPMKAVDSFKENLQKTTKSTETISSDFIQSKYLSFLSEEIESTGSFSFKKENLLRWEYTEPFEYLIILNDSKLQIKDEEDVSNFDLESNQTFQKINDLIINSVQGNILDDELYEMDFKENKEHFFVELQPKEAQMSEYMNAIHLYFNRENYSIVKIKMLEGSGDYTIIKFSNQKLNTSISDELFSIN